MNRCWCDQEGPHIYGPLFTSHEMLTLHRATHELVKFMRHNL